MKKYIVFGAGKVAEKEYDLISNLFDIVAFSDNDKSKWGTCFLDHPIVSPMELANYDFDYVLICTVHYKEIQKQLLEYGIKNIRIIVNGLIYEYGADNLMAPVNMLNMLSPYIKKDSRMHILFIQTTLRIRACKLAEALKEKEVSVCLLCLDGIDASVKAYLSCFDHIYRASSFDEMIGFINNSDFDLVQCFNEPDVLMCVVQDRIKQPIIHDNADFISLRDRPDLNMLGMEYIANTKSDGYVYVSKGCLEMAVDRYHVDKNKAAVIENRPSLSALPNKELRKLSSIDNEIHIVYQGGISDDPTHFRYYEKQWLLLSNMGINIHFFSQANEGYCWKLDSLHEKIHYEGNISADKLLTEMTQYDCGWCVFGEMPAYKLKLDTTSSNKIYEYLAAGLPIVVSNHQFHIDLLKKYDVGEVIDWNRDIKKQIESVCKKRVGLDFVRDNNLTIESQIDDLVSLYYSLLGK